MRVLFATLFIVIADQLTKFLVKGGSIPLINWNVKGMEYAESFNVIGDFFKITFVENPGLAFGIDINDSSKLILSIFTLFASIGIFYYLYKSKDQKFIVRLALAFILGGAIGNLIDRTFYGVFYGYAPIFYGKVVDFFNVDFFDFTIFGRTYDRWPIFNIADASVTVGVILLIIFHRNPDEKTETDSIANNEVALSSSSVEGESISEAVQNEDVTVNENSQIENGKTSNREENIN